MKKLFAMLMALTILMTMAACGQQTADDAGGTVDPGAVADRDTSGQVDMPADDAGTPELGSVNGGTYTNEFAGIGCTLDETWTFYTEAQIADNFHSFYRINIVVHIAHFYAEVFEIIRQIFRHLFCERSQKNALFALDSYVYLGYNIVYLTLGRSD